MAKSMYKLLGADGATWEIQDNSGVVEYVLDGTAVTSTAAEMNKMDGVTATTAELNILDGVLSTAAEINRATDVSTRIVVEVGTALAVTELLHDNKTILMSETGGDAAATYTLPAATGSGARFRFAVGVINTSNYLIKVADATDVMFGNVITSSTGDTPDLAQPWTTAADSDTITLNGTTSGGVAIGDWIELEDLATNQWAVYGVTTTSGTEVTPFSATVA